MPSLRSEIQGTLGCQRGMSLLYGPKGGPMLPLQSLLTSLCLMICHFMPSLYCHIFLLFSILPSPFLIFFLFVVGMHVRVRVCLLCAVTVEAEDSLGPQLSTLVLRSRSLVGWNFLIRLGFLLSDPLGACPCLCIVGIAGACCCTRLFIQSRVFIFMWRTFFQLCHLPSPCGYIFFSHLDPKVCLM